MLFSSNQFRDVSPEFWEKALLDNAHGIGIMWHKNGKQFQSYKTKYLSVPELLKKISDARTTGPMAVHLRDATTGDLSLDNAHPHVLKGPRSGWLGMMHNGTLPAFAPKPGEYISDSKKFLEQHLALLLPQSFTVPSKSLLDKLDKSLPERNRMIFADDEGNWALLREKEGFWLTPETWVSNPKAKTY